MGTEVIAERWNLLIIRELLTGAQRFNDIHRGLPGLSRTLLSQRLRALQRYGLVEPLPTDGPSGCGYQLTGAGEDLRTVIDALALWAVRWRFPEPADEQLNPHLLLWRMRTGLAHARLPPRRVVIEFDFEGDRPERGWLILDGDDSSACLRDPLFGTDLYARATSRVWHEIWYGRRSIHQSIRNGDVVLNGERELLTQFVHWFQLSHFAPDIASRHSPQDLPGRS
jgi:DNA-binding HxlR family transcriptional regulator